MTTFDPNGIPTWDETLDRAAEAQRATLRDWIACRRLLLLVAAVEVVAVLTVGPVAR